MGNESGLEHDEPGKWSDVMKVPEIAEYLKLHPETVREYMRLGRIRGTRAGGKSWMSRKRWVDQYLDDSAQGGGSPPRPVRVRVDKRRHREAAHAGAAPA